MHQAFYHHHEQMLRDWDDEVYRNKNLVMSNELSTMWNLIDSDSFINKDSTAHHIMIEQGSLEDSFIVFHPSALGHKIWGQYMFDFCKERNII